MNSFKSTPKGTTQEDSPGAEGLTDVAAAGYAGKLAQRVQARGERYYQAAGLRATARRLSIHESVRKCGMVSRRASGVGVVANVNDPVGGRVAGFRGLCSCSNVWSCSRCGGVIGAKRAEEIQHCMEEWREHGATMNAYSMVPVVDGFGCYEDPKYPGQPFSGEDPWDWGIEDPERPGEYVSGPRRTVDGVVLGLKPRMERKGTPVVHEAGEVLFGTLTLRHQKATAAQVKAGVTTWDLETLWEVVRKAFERFTQDRYWKTNITASIVTVEQTYSKKTGWHVHLHLMLFVSKEFAADVVELEEGMVTAERSCQDCKPGRPCARKQLIERARKNKTTKLKQKWVDAVKAKGYTATMKGQHFRVASDEDVEKLAQYVTKVTRWNVADEMAKWNKKKAEGVSVNMHEVLLFLHHAYQVQAEKPRRLSKTGASQSERVVADFRERKIRPAGKGATPSDPGLSKLDNEIADWEEIYRTYEAASKGKRMHTWTWGMREAFGLDDKTDQEIADENDDADPIDELDKGTAEIAGFPNAKSWFKFASDFKRPVALKIMIESAASDDVMSKMETWKEETGLPVLLGDAWNAHRLSFEDGEDAFPVDLAG